MPWAISLRSFGKHRMQIDECRRNKTKQRYSDKVNKSVMNESQIIEIIV